MNWDDLRFVLALSRAGSLARASRILGVDHTTVGRRIEALEEALSVRLFTRTTAGYVATQEAEDLLPGMRAVEESVFALERAASGGETRVRGKVRITTGEAFGAMYVAPRLDGFARAHPAVSVELSTSVQTLDLGRREADVALRFFRSAPDDLVVRKLADIGYAVYASKGYIARRGMPKESTLASHDAVGLAGYAPPPEDAWFERVALSARFVLRTNSTMTTVSAVRAGLGMALLPAYLADADKELRRVNLGDPPVRPVWLTVHRDMQKTPRVRVMMDYLAEMLRKDAQLLRGKTRTKAREGSA